jgi:membrane-associated phospholipid phosphatase
VVFPFAALLVLLFVGAVRALSTPDRSLATLATRSKILIADWLPLVVGVLVYENVHDLTYVIRPDTVDAELRVLDDRLFGITPALAFDRIVAPWLNELMSAAYALYFLYPLLILVLTYRFYRPHVELIRSAAAKPRLHSQSLRDTRSSQHESSLVGERRIFREFSLALSLCLYLGLLGYVLVPAIGPRFAMASEFHGALVGPWLTVPAARAWNFLEKIERDCFPSLHTALTLLSLIYFVRLRTLLPYGRALLAVVTPAIVLLWVSTMYLRYHYGVDVIAGALLAWAVSRVAPRGLALYERALRRV